MAIVEVKNPAALVEGPVAELLADAFNDYLVPLNEAIITELESGLGDYLRLLVGFTDDGEAKALSLIMFPTTALAPIPQVINFYNAGKVRLRNALVDATVELIKAHGYTTFWALNENGDPRRARAFKRAGVQAKKAEFVEFTVK